MKRIAIIACGLALLCTACKMHAPDFSYYDEPQVQEQRKDTFDQLINLLPPEQRAIPAAREEAAWLVEHGFKAGISIARVNDPIGMGWQNNRAVNSPDHIRERGLCWQYQADMYRELRRRHLEYFALGCCWRDGGTADEHNSLYIRAAAGRWPDAILMDPWSRSGRLNIMNRKDIAIEKWQDLPAVRSYLAGIYKENHSFPIEHWERVQSDTDNRRYVSVFTAEGRNSRQGKIMRANMERGLKARNGRLTDY